MANAPPKQDRLKKVQEIKEVPKIPERAPEVEIGQPAVEKSIDVEVAPHPVTTFVGEAPEEDQLISTLTSHAAPMKSLDRLEEEIEDILEEDLNELYVAMPPDKQAEFKRKGEATRSKIRELVSTAKINAKKIFQLIRAWLKIIPGVDRFFWEQESKIKTDKILLVSKEEKKRSERL